MERKGENMDCNKSNDPFACSSRECCSGINRRGFLKSVGLGATAVLSSGLPVMAGPFEAADFEKLIPADKKLSPEWVKSLFARGGRAVYRGAELEKIGMPVGGICTGQLYLGGDGNLWHWDIFNQHVRTGPDHYANPPKPSSPLDQGFALRISAGGKTQVRALDRAGFSHVTFCGEYPIGYVEYRDDALPVTVLLEAFSPFIPLNADDSSLPATIMQFTVKNISREKAECELAGWLENAVCLHSAQTAQGKRRNRVLHQPELTFLECSTEPSQQPPQQETGRPPIVFADFEGDTYGNWKVEGEAFGKGPAKGARNPVQRLSGFQGKALANSWPGSDKPRGKLISPSFTIERPFVNFLIGGGNHPNETCINLLVADKVVRSETGKNADRMAWASWNVKDLAGKTARMEIVDNHSGGWGHIDIDQIEFADQPLTGVGKIEDQPDFGTMGLALLGRGDDRARAEMLDSKRPEASFEDARQGTDSSTKPFGEMLCGRLSRKFTLEPGQGEKVTFVVAWHFPNLRFDKISKSGRHYANRFKSAAEVAEHVAKSFDPLCAQTRLWHDTWYDSTLPRWFLDRTFANTSILATSTCHWFGSGRFYGWEGVGCCPGTCAHVWHYAHAVARLFPQLERSAREMQDFDIGFDPDTGAIRFRGEFNNVPAADGQAGCILRAYREHQMSADEAFLRRNWPKIKKSLEYLIGQDASDDGILEGKQHNTLDTDWYGPVAWLSSLYLAALRAGEGMAEEMGDEAFAGRASAILGTGSKKIVETLWNGEYFIHKPDPTHPEAMKSGNGCEIDQVFGQSWAFQVGLGRITSEKHVKQALRSLWKYNFTPDVGPYREVHKSGRWYAMPGEAGLLMCTWPLGDKKDTQGKAPDWAYGYFNECMNGFEYQVAGHMIWEGMVMEGMAIARAVHDRYHALRRNPWNEIECGDHYARSMASYGVFLAACGYEYHGPKGHLGFAPRLTPEDFRAAFTTAEGWGTFSQKIEGGRMKAEIALKWGTLRVRTLSLALPENAKPAKVTVTIAGKPVRVTHGLDGVRIQVSLPTDITIKTGQSLDVIVA